MSSLLLQNIRTTDDIDLLKDELEALKNTLYQSTNKYNNILNSGIRNWVSEIIKKEANKENMEEYIENIYKEMRSRQIISIGINFEPSELFIDTMSLWLKKNVNDKLVVDIILNSTIIGGVQISYKGKYLDLSLRKRISSEFKNLKLVNK